MGNLKVCVFVYFIEHGKRKLCLKVELLNYFRVWRYNIKDTTE